MHDLYNVIIICPRPKNKNKSMQLELNIQQLPSKKKRKKRKKHFIFGWYMPIINKTIVHHIAQLMNMLKPTLHFPIEDARSVS